MLALIGSGEYLPPMEPVDRFLLAQLADTPRVICLPTAAGAEGAERIHYWSELGVHYFNSLGAAVQSLPVIDRQSADNPAIAAEIRAANFVYLSGGHPGYLSKTLLGSRAWQAVESVIDKGGLLAGCSAGAMVMASATPAFPRWQRAFNLIPQTVIIPHFDEIPERYMKIIRWLTNRRSTLLGIEGNTALFIAHEHWQVIGAGLVTVWDETGRRQYSTGETVQLKSMPP